MAQIVADSFDGASGQTLEAYNPNWVKTTGNTGSFTINGVGAVRNNSGASASYYRQDAMPPGPDYSVSGDITSGGFPGVCARVSTTANTYYLARLNGNTVEIYRCVAGALSLISSQSTGRTASVYNVRLECVGSLQRVYVDGSTTALFETTDTRIVEAGKPGIRANSATTGGTIDNFSADSIGGGDSASGSLGSLLDQAAMQCFGAVTAAGAFSSMLDNANMAASGTAGNAPSGAFTAQLAGASMVATGAVLNRGALASALAGAGLAASGVVATNASGAFAATLAGAELFASGYPGRDAPPDPVRPYRWRVMRRHFSNPGTQ